MQLGILIDGRFGWKRQATDDSRMLMLSPKLLDFRVLTMWHQAVSVSTRATVLASTRVAAAAALRSISLCSLSAMFLRSLLREPHVDAKMVAPAQMTATPARPDTRAKSLVAYLPV